MTTDINSDSAADVRNDEVRSAWSIWLHPRRSHREMEALQEEVATLQDLLGRTDRDRTRLIEEVTRKNEDIARISDNARQDVDELRSQLRELESNNKDLNKELGEWRQTRLELDALEEQLKEWENVKAKYEERIKMLTLRLRDALGHRTPMRTADIDSDILEEGENPYLTPEEREAMAKRKADADIATRLLADMFPDDQPLDMTAPIDDAASFTDVSGSPSPSVPFSPSSYPYTQSSSSERKEGAKPKGRIPGGRRLPKDDTDWLITLPPE